MRQLNLKAKLDKLRPTINTERLGPYPAEVIDFPEGMDRVYGEFKRQPIEGPVTYEHFYRDWTKVGSIGSTDPLTTEEIEFCRKYGIEIELSKKLGSGGYGTVFDCDYKTFDPFRGIGRSKKLAVKVLDVSRFKYKKSSMVTPKLAVDEMLREVNILKDLNHPNVVTFEGMFHIHHPITGFPSIKLLMFMELCEGNLLTYIDDQQNHRLVEDEAKRIMKQLCKGLKYLHNKNVVHFDLKPANVLYVTNPSTGKRVYKLTDFGLAKKFETSGPRATDAGGTRDYTAPEVGKVPEFSAKKADIYSLGCTLAVMLFGGPWKQITDMFRGTPWPPSSQQMQSIKAQKNVGFEAIDLLRWMTRADPTERPKIKRVLTHKWFKM